MEQLSNSHGKRFDCKSPNRCLCHGKNLFAQKKGHDPLNIVVVSIKPSTAKNYECQRDEMKASGYQDGKILYNREASRMLKEKGMIQRDAWEDFDSSPWYFNRGRQYLSYRGSYGSCSPNVYEVFNRRHCIGLTSPMSRY
jgi:NADH-quinone oxidoreductase subunit G/NADP-reducing hydrogenase subunit HndD